LLRKILTAIVVIPIAIIMIAFAVANRHSVTISLDPFSSNDPVASVTLPLFALIFFLLIVGVFIGGAATWLRHGRWRWRALPRRACNSVRRRPAPSFGPRRLSYPAVRTRQA
jgi:uncharacterized integral membrane protein